MDGEISFKEYNEMLMERARDILEKEPSKKEKDPVSVWTVYLCEKVEPYYYENGKETGFNNHGSSASVGFYAKREDAVDAMHKNACDIRECFYEYGCIEEVKEGLYGSVPGSVQWFMWNEEKGGFYEIETPKGEENVCGYVI